jgi:hypothetical protein
MLANSRSYLLLIAALSLLASGEAQAQLVQGGGSGIVTEPPPVVVTNCTITTADFINDAGPFHTASGTFVAIPGMTKAVKVDGTTSSCVLAVVSGDSMTTSGEAIYVGVTLDGHLGNPSFVQFSMNDPSAAQEHAALFAFRSVAPGTHTVAMVFKSAFGGTVSISRPAMRIDHR